MRRVFGICLSAPLVALMLVGTIAFFPQRAFAHDYTIVDGPDDCCVTHYLDCVDDAWKDHPDPVCQHTHQCLLEDICIDNNSDCGNEVCGAPGCWPFEENWPYEEVCDDWDGDGIVNRYEYAYDPDLDDDEFVELALGTMGGSIWVKDVYVELDYLEADDHSHAPKKDAVEAVVQAFANAPVENVIYRDGTKVWGVQLHVDTGPLYGPGEIYEVHRNIDSQPGAIGTYGDLRRLHYHIGTDKPAIPIPVSDVEKGGGEAIDEDGNEYMSFEAVADSGVANFYDLKSDYFASDYRRPFFRYGIFGHYKSIKDHYPDQDCTSGSAETGEWADDAHTVRYGGNDFMVTLGGVHPNALPTAGDPCHPDEGGAPGGTTDAHTATFFHELGHNLGLQHGGVDSFNHKPNYYSVMNYLFQFDGIPADYEPPLVSGFDFSRIECPTLNEWLGQQEELGLDECVGINCLPIHGPRHWNDNGIYEGVTCDDVRYQYNIQVDINDDGDECALKGFDDWQNLAYDFKWGDAYADGSPGDAHDEQNPAQIAYSRYLLGELFGAKLVLEKAGPANASPGETISYTLAVGNVGQGPATVTVLTDTLPDGTTQTFDLGTMAVAAEEMRFVEFTVPLVPDASQPGRLLNQATVAYENFLGDVKEASDAFEVNRIPLCDANGPYTAECGADTELDGSGSVDHDGDALTFTWFGAFEGGTASGEMPSVVFPAPTGSKAIGLDVTDGLATQSCAADVNVVDTLGPSITAPPDVSAECASPAGTTVALGTPVVNDLCDDDVAVTDDAPALFPLGTSTVTWAATDDAENVETDEQIVVIEDSVPPEIYCNSPATIAPPDAPITFTASAEDQCAGTIVPRVTGYDCFVYTKKGKRVDKTESCVVSFTGDTVTILDSGGVDDNIEWVVLADDGNGNTATQVCSLVVANPAE